MNNNYTYIIASLPVLSPDYRPAEGGDCSGVIEWIKSQLDAKDAARADFVVKGFTPGCLDEEFYLLALKEKNRFIREFFTADLRLRNAKVAYLNSSLGRKEGTDVITIEGLPEDCDAQKVRALFGNPDLLGREKSVDDYLWKKADSIVLLENFTLDNVLALVAKLCIIQRWMALDETTGRQLLRRLVGDVRGTYGKIEFETIK